jgi:hypothetical protein
MDQVKGRVFGSIGSLVILAGLACAPTPIFVERSGDLLALAESAETSNASEDRMIISFSELTSLAASSSEIGVDYRLVGTTGFNGQSLPRRTITVGPDVFAGALLETDEVIDLAAVGSLSDVVELPATGGTVDGFLEIGVSGESDGLMGAIVDITCDGSGEFVTGFLYDIAFRDAPGRTAMIQSFVADIPDERRIAGARIDDEGAQFIYTFFSPFSAAAGEERLPEYIYEAGFINNGIEGGDPAQTFGVGMLGQGQSSGPTIVARFRYVVEPLPAGQSKRVFSLMVEPVSTLCYLQDAHFIDPSPGPLDIARPGFETVAPLTVIQGQ